MKNGVLKFAFRDLKNNKVFFSFAVILLVFSFVLFAVCEFLYVRIEYNRHVADRVLAKGIENTGLMELCTYNNDDLVNFLIEAYKDGMVDSIGSSCAYFIKWKCLDELIERQNGKSRLNVPDYDDESLAYLCVDPTLMNLCDLKLQDGSMLDVDNFDYEDRNLVAMYLGDLFSDIPVGTEYKLKLGKERVLTIRVMGIIAKGEEWLDESVGISHGDIIKASYNLDNEVIMAFNDVIFNGGMFYSVKDGSTMEETQKALYDLADKHNLDIITGGISARFDGVENQYSDLRDTLFALMVFITAASIMIIICFNAVSILSCKKQYGVLLAGGLSKNALFFSLFIEQLIKVVVGFVLSGLIIYAFTPLFFNLEDIAAVYDIFLHFVLWKTVVFGLIECVVVSGVSVFILGRYKPVELIKYRY